MTEPLFRAVSLVGDQLVVHESLESAYAALRDDHVTWIDLLGRDEAGEKLLGAGRLGLHPLIIEDIFNDCMRPKIEANSDHLYMLFHAPSLTARDDDPGTLDLTEIDVVFGSNWVVSHHAQESRAMDTVFAESYRDLIAATFEAHLSVQSNKMNAIMKTLTLMTALFGPLTFIAGVYGMNFKHMPELERPWAYPAVLCGMVGIALGVFVFYRRKRWI